MTEDGGLGAVTIKNINLLNRCSEKISAVLKDCDSQEIWLITLSSDTGQQENWHTFYAFTISDLGVDPVPVSSTVSTLSVFDIVAVGQRSPSAGYQTVYRFEIWWRSYFVDNQATSS